MKPVGGEVVPRDGAERTTSFLLDRLASYLHASLAAYAEARPLFERALAIRDKALSPEDPEIASNLNDLAVVLVDLGRRPKTNESG